jgi:hypothetical protein
VISLQSTLRHLAASGNQRLPVICDSLNVNFKKAVHFLVPTNNTKGVLRSRLLELFCRVDDFWLVFAKGWKQRLLHSGQIKRLRSGQLAESEIMTILIHFHHSHFRDFKAFYTGHVLVHLRSDFPGLVS